MSSNIQHQYQLKKAPVILAIESSCDETAAAILQNGKVYMNNMVG